MGSKTKNLLVYKPMHPGYQDKNQHPDGLCVPCCFGRPTDVGDGDWVKRKNKSGEIEYYNKKTNAKPQSNFPKNLIKYPNSYMPNGKSKHGEGPEYELDSKGNIIMSSIKGEQTSRDPPATQIIN